VPAPRRDLIAVPLPERPVVDWHQRRFVRPILEQLTLVGHLGSVVRAPEFRPVGGVDEIGLNSQFPAMLRDAAHQHGADSKLLADFLRKFLIPLVTKDGAPRQDLHVRQLRERAGLLPPHQGIADFIGRSGIRPNTKRHAREGPRAGESPGFGQFRIAAKENRHAQTAIHSIERPMLKCRRADCQRCNQQ